MINDSIDESIIYYSNLRKLFEEMCNKYGINMPDIDMVIGEKGNGQKYVFMVVDKIEGENLVNLQSLPEKEKEKFETFYLGLLRSTFDAYKSRKPFFSDSVDRNIMYGHKSKEKDGQEDFFLIDVGGDGFIREKGEYIVYDHEFFAHVFCTELDLHDFEIKFGENVVLGKIRSKLDEIYRYLVINKRPELKDFFFKSQSGNMQIFLNKLTKSFNF